MASKLTKGIVQILVHSEVRLQRMRVVLAIALLAAAVSPAYAQSKDPLPTFVVDVRGLFAKLGQDTTTAADLGVTSQQLPGTAIGAAVGVNFYPLKKKKMSLGFGAEGLLARAVDQQAANAQTGTSRRPAHRAPLPGHLRHHLAQLRPRSGLELRQRRHRPDCGFRPLPAICPRVLRPSR